MRVLAIVLVATLAGCQSMSMDPYRRGEALNGPLLSVSDTWLKRFADKPNDANLRKEFAFHQIAESDRKCENYLIGISAGNNALGGSLDLLTLGLNLAGSGTSSLSTAQDLAAGAGLSQTLRQSATRNIFAGSEFSVIYDTVHRGRKAERDELVKTINDGKFDTWGPEAITAVVAVYDLQCGINYASRLVRSAIVAQKDVETNTPLPQ